MKTTQHIKSPFPLGKGGYLATPPEGAWGANSPFLWVADNSPFPLGKGGLLALPAEGVWVVLWYMLANCIKTLQHIKSSFPLRIENRWCDSSCYRALHLSEIQKKRDNCQRSIMKHHIITLIVFISLITSLFPQQPSDFYNPPPPQYEKSPSKALIFSAVAPGAGQFYVDYAQWTAYVFPVIEIGLWATLIHYHNKGINKEREYERFADAHYKRSQQNQAQLNLIMQSGSSDLFYVGGSFNTLLSEGKIDEWGNGGHFRLDDTNTQHFYEDIAKYDKYIFGWDDWFAENWNNGNVAWEFDEDGKYTSPDNISSLRASYIAMRIKAEDYYSTSRSMRFFLVANHALAALDAFRVAKKYNNAQANRQYSQSQPIQIKPQLQTLYINDNLVPVIGLVMRF